MSIFQNATRPQFSIPGLKHRALAGFRDGLTGIDVSLKEIAPGGSTPVHYHDCEEVVVVLAGKGSATIGDEPRREFAAEMTLVMPTGVIHQFENAGDEPLVLLCEFSKTPSKVFRADGSEIPVPWGAGAEA